MKINLHIERLILDGLPISPDQKHLVQASVEAELSRMLSEGGLAQELASGGAVPSVPGGSIKLAPGAKPNQIGAQVARAVYKGMGR